MFFLSIFPSTEKWTGYIFLQKSLSCYSFQIRYVLPTTTAKVKNHAIYIHANASDAGFEKRFAEEMEIAVTDWNVCGVDAVHQGPTEPRGAYAKRLMTVSLDYVALRNTG